MPYTAWLNDNGNRSYPFIDRSVGEDGIYAVAGLPDSAIVEAGFVAGPSSEYISGVHSVFLKTVTRAGSYVSFNFECDSPGLVNIPLSFVFSLSEALYTTQHLDSAVPVTVSQSLDVSETTGPCDLPSWWGFITIGDLSALTDWIEDGDTFVRVGTAGTVEPALIQNLASGYVESVSIANTDRTRATNPVGCADMVWPFDVGRVWTWRRCVRGDIRIVAGHNCTITQDTTSRTLSFGARPKAGAGEPCAELPIFTAEQSSTNLAGGPRCTDVIRSINGVGGPHLQIRSESGAAIVASLNTLTVDVNMTGLAGCFHDYDRVSESL